MNVLIEGNNIGDVLHYEAPNLFSRKAVSVRRNRTLLVGTVLGARTKSSVVAVAGANIGNGTCESMTLGDKAQVGQYSVVCIEAPTAPAASGTATAYPTNTGNGVMGAITVTSDAKVGTYRVEMVSTGATAGFTVTDPDGEPVGNGAVGSAFTLGGLSFTLADGAADYQIGDGFTITVGVNASGAGGTWNVLTPDGIPLLPAAVGAAYTSSHLNFTLTDGATNFVEGDSFTITVSGDGYVTALDHTSVDGTQEAIGVLFADVTAPVGSEATGVAIVRNAICIEDGLVWPVGISAGQKTNALAQLEAKGIITRKGV